MSVLYTYSLSTDFGGNLDQGQFHQEVQAVLPTIETVQLKGDVVTVWFTGSINQTTLDGLVAAHSPDPTQYNEHYYLIDKTFDNYKPLEPSLAPIAWYPFAFNVMVIGSR